MAVDERISKKHCVECKMYSIPYPMGTRGTCLRSGKFCVHERISVHKDDCGPEGKFWESKSGSTKPV